MDPKLAFWTGALANFAVIVVLAYRGVGARRAGRIARHRRLMLGAGALVLAFVASYGLKLWWLGREDLSSWSPFDLWVLRIHELCVFTMVLAGGVAAWRGRALRRTRLASGDPADPAPEPRLPSRHRGAGWTAVVAAVLGFATASMVLAGMYSRAGVF